MYAKSESPEQAYSSAEVDRGPAAPKQADEGTHTGEERLHRVLESSGDCMLLLDLAGHIQWSNTAARRAFALDKNPPSAPELWSELWEEGARVDAFALVAAGEGRMTGVRLAGSQVSKWWTVVVTSVRDAAGQAERLLAVARDGTERRHLEEQVLRAQRVEGIGLLAAGVAHDLNNVLSPILLGVPMLAEHLSDPDDRALLTMIGQSAQRGAGLVQQILKYARGSEVDRRALQVKHLLRDIAEIIHETFPKTIRLETKIGADLWLVEANPTQIHQVLFNLCVNARDAMTTGGVIGLSLANWPLAADQAAAIEGARPGRFVVLEVSDTGPGIPPEILSRMWEPFFTTKESGKGTGLGLSTVLGIVKSHGGFVSLETAPDRGTTFRVWLPAAVGLAEKAHAPLKAEANPGFGQLILVVEDDANVRAFLTGALRRRGYRVLAARDGAEAMTRYAMCGSEISVVVTDLDMPNLGGAGLVRGIRQLNPAARIVAISGSERPSAADLKMAIIGVSFVAKPFLIEDLLAQIDLVCSIPLAPS